MQTQKKENHHSNYQHYLKCCADLGIPDLRHELDQMLVIDFLLVNEDRHFNNFDIIRNAETLDWIGAAPIYDTGTALWFSTPTKLIHPAAVNLPSKPFRDTHREMCIRDRTYTDLGFDVSELFSAQINEFNAIFDSGQRINDKLLYAKMCIRDRPRGHR